MDVIDLQSAVFHKIFDTVNYYFNIAGNGHFNNSFSEEVAGDLIIYDNDSGCSQERDPRFDDLSMDKTIVDPYKNAIHGITHRSFY